MTEEPELGTNIQMLKSFLDRKPVRAILSLMTHACPKDRKSFLETALELISGVREEACFLCTHVATPLVRWALSTSCRHLNTDLKKLKETLKLSYWRRGIVSVLKGIAKFGVRRPFTPGAPILVVWNFTWACNLRCKHCYAKAGPRPRPNELSTSETLRTVHMLADAGVTIIALSGGEPLMRKDAYKVLELARDYGIYTAIATNGTLITREVAKRLKELDLLYVEISVDGARPETHDEFRGIPGAFEMAMRGVRNCVEAGIWTQVAMTITRDNVAELPAVIELCERLGVQGLTCFNFVPTGRGVAITDRDLSPEEREEVLRYMIREVLKGRELQIVSTAPQYARVALQVEEAMRTGRELVVPMHFWNPRFSREVASITEFIGGCGAGRFYCALDPDGTITPCVFMPVKVGSVRELGDFEEFWDTCPVFWDLRDRDKLKPHCGECEYRFVCGGCRARAYGYFGDYLAPDPGCINNLRAWEELRPKPLAHAPPLTR